MLDYRLPCMTGAELYKRLKEKGVTAPALLVTAHVSHDTFEQAHDAGIAKVIEKPVHFDELIQAIESQAGDA